MNKSSAVAGMSYRLATMDMGPKVGAAVPVSGTGSPSNTMWLGPKGGGAAVALSGGSEVPGYHKVAGAKAYLHTKWHLDPSSRLATIDMG